MKLALIFLILAALGAGGYLAYIMLTAWSFVKTMPREDMFICTAGHMVLKKNLINFMGEDFCPICFHNRLKSAEQGGV